jgi:hypothetical protein
VCLDITRKSQLFGQREAKKISCVHCSDRESIKVEEGAVCQLRQSVHQSKRWRGILLPHIDDDIVYESVFHHVSMFYESFTYLYCVNFFLYYCCMDMRILIMQGSGVNSCIMHFLHANF